MIDRRSAMKSLRKCLLTVAGCLMTVSAYAGTPLIELSTHSVMPGATVSLSGKRFGQFKSVQTNRVTFNGVPALVQRWEPDVIEVKVPLKASSGPVEVSIGKKKLQAGTITIVQPHIESITPT